MGGDRLKLLRRYYLTYLLLCVVFLVVTTLVFLVSLFFVKTSNIGDSVLAAFIYFLGLCAVMIFIRWSIHTRIEVTIARLIILLDRHPENWQRVKVIRRLNSKLRVLAGLLERIPWELKALHPEVVALAARKAAGVRELQLWVSRPGPTTFDDLRVRLCGGLVLVLDNLWHDLDEGVPVPVPMSRTRQIVWIGAALLSAAAGAGVLILDVPWSQIAAYSLFTSAILFLNKANIAIGNYQQALEVAKTVAG